MIHGSGANTKQDKNMEKLKMHSPNLTEDNIARIRELFPGCVTEARGEDGSVKLAVDFDQLKQELSAAIVDGPQERYHLNWPGKREALLTANAPIAKTLRPVRGESVDFDTTKNLFIEGDNLDALKLLQETYLGKVKLIYLDPPYNRKKGNNLVYRDDFVGNTYEHLKEQVFRRAVGLDVVHEQDQIFLRKRIGRVIDVRHVRGVDLEDAEANVPIPLLSAFLVAQCHARAAGSLLRDFRNERFQADLRAELKCLFCVLVVLPDFLGVLHADESAIAAITAADFHRRVRQC